MTQLLRRLISIPVFAALPLCAAAQTAIDNPPDPYIHVQTGMAFPATVSGAVRHQVNRYNADGSDIGIGYQVVRGGKMVAYLSIFVYPARPLDSDTPGERQRACAALSDGIKRDILSHEADAKLVIEQSVAAPSSNARLHGLRVIYSGGRGNFDGGEQALREQNDLFCFAGRKWLIAYRITMPAGVDASADVERVEHAIPWTDALSG
jgi:hypothetical protein